MAMEEERTMRSIGCVAGQGYRGEGVAYFWCARMQWTSEWEILTVKDGGGYSVQGMVVTTGRGTKGDHVVAANVRFLILVHKELSNLRFY